MILPRIEHALNEFHCRPTKWQLFRRSGAQNGDSIAILQAYSLDFDLIMDEPLCQAFAPQGFKAPVASSPQSPSISPGESSKLRHRIRRIAPFHHLLYFRAV